MIGMLSAIAVVLMFFEFPIPFVAPPFYKLDLSEIPVLIGTLLAGPIVGIVIEAVKILLVLLLKGTTTVYVGELANFLIGCAFVVPTGLILMRIKNAKGSILGLLVGGVTMVLVGALMNAFVLLPMYAQLYFGGMGPVLEAGAALNANITDITTFVLIAVTPFNIIKAVLCGGLSYCLYIPLKKITH